MIFSLPVNVFHETNQKGFFIKFLRIVFKIKKDSYFCSLIFNTIKKEKNGKP
jgi:hypothetical protein